MIRRISMTCVVLMMFGVSLVRAETAPTTQPVTVIPVPNTSRPQDHEQNLKRIAQGPIGVAFIGDSITWGWGGAADIWEQSFGQYQPANFGVPGDRTQNVLWRLDHGELDGYQAKVVVLLIGTNNMGNPAKDIALGTQKIIQLIQEKQPQASILLLAAFPRANKTDKVRHEVQEYNEELQKLGDDQKVRFLDIGSHFLSPDGILSTEIMPDLLHLSHQGYEIWAQNMGPVLDEMMQSHENEE